jgi:predicted RND superfamily exporter protein
MSKLANGIVRFRWVIIVGTLALAVGFGRQLPRAEIDSNMKSMLPPDIQSRINTDTIDELFGGTDMLMVLVQTEDVLNPDTLNRVKSLSRQLKRVKGVDKVLSLFDLKNITAQDGAMIVEPAVYRIPRNAEQREKLRDEIRGNDIVYGSVVSEDFTLTAVIALLKTDVSDDAINREVAVLLEKNPGPEEIFLGGLPYTRFQVSDSIQTDLRRLLPLGLLIMLFFLFLCFRQIRGVLLPFLVVILSIAFAMGLIPLLGWKIQVITIVLPVMLIAIANDYGIHLVAKYQELNLPDNPDSNREIAKKVFLSLSRPVILTGLTTIAGMLCLLGHIIIPARQLSILAAMGIVFALTASLLFIPAVLSLLPKAKPVLGSGDGRHRARILERLLGSVGRLVASRPRPIIGISLALALAVAVGILFVIIDTDPNNYYPQDHPVARSAQLVNRKMGGAQNISIVFQGDIKEPRIMHSMDAMETRLAQMPDVGNTTSIARVIRQMSRALHDPAEPGYDSIPDTRNAIAQYFELYSMSGDPDDFEKMVDFPYEHAMLTARLKTSSTQKLASILRQVNRIVEGDPDVMLVGGFASILSELARAIVNGQILSLVLAIVAVGILLMLLFRSITAGLISAIPLALSMAVLFGLMGIFRIELNVATAMLSSIMIGVGVDYTIHFLWRYREERSRGGEPEGAVKTTLTTTGRGIVFNALSVVIGFAVLMVSGFMPVRFFGFLVVVSILSCLIGALILIPALCLVLRPKFLEPPVQRVIPAPETV